MGDCGACGYCFGLCASVMVGAEDPERIKIRDHKQREVVDVFRFIDKCFLLCGEK